VRARVILSAAGGFFGFDIFGNIAQKDCKGHVNIDFMMLSVYVDFGMHKYGEIEFSKRN